MQTFLPYGDYEQSAQVLDNRRLGKQRVECLQILKALTVETYGWKNHPAVKMWVGYEASLVDYSIYICDEWIKRGFKDTCREKIFTIAEANNLLDDVPIAPQWLYDERIHASHRSNLLRKAPEHYNQFNWSESADLAYFWPHLHYNDLIKQRGYNVYHG